MLATLHWRGRQPTRRLAPSLRHPRSAPAAAPAPPPAPCPPPSPSPDPATRPRTFSLTGSATRPRTSSRTGPRPCTSTCVADASVAQRSGCWGVARDCGVGNDAVRANKYRARNHRRAGNRGPCIPAERVVRPLDRHAGLGRVVAGQRRARRLLRQRGRENRSAGRRTGMGGELRRQQLATSWMPLLRARTHRMPDTRTGSRARPTATTANSSWNAKTGLCVWADPRPR